jgi:ribose 5-phosphate isomerase B
VRVAVAFDHRGAKLREDVSAAVAALGHEVLDLGVDAPEPRVDYPDKAREIGSGVGASVAANKLPGIRAAVCHDAYSAHQGVEHDAMNVLCLGSEIVGAALARDLVRVFLKAQFDGGERYVKRLEKIEAMEGLRHG